MHLQRPHPCNASQQSLPRLARIGSLRKIICTLQNALAEKSAEKLRGGLRCATRGTLRIPTPLLRYRTATPQKKTTVKKSYQETPFKKWFLIDFRKLFRIRIGCVEKCVKYVKKSVLYKCLKNRKAYMYITNKRMEEEK